MKIAVAGVGNIGSGVLQLLASNAELVAERAGKPVTVVAAANQNLGDLRERFDDSIEWHNDWRALTARKDVDVVVELIGGTTEAKLCVLESLANGKAVVTANKALLAEQGHDIFAKANECGATIMYEAAIAGAIPIVKVIREALAANRFHSITGILNGTCNYILTSMEKGNGSFVTCLKEAQELGFAEANPALDIDGVDSAHKIALLGMIALNAPLDLGAVRIQGISAIGEADFLCAQDLGYCIRLLATARCGRNGRIQMMSHPMLLPADHIMAKVDRNMNAVSVISNAAGETLYYGAGAGPLPTASAVVSDLIDIAKGRVQATDPGHGNEAVTPASEAEATAFYLRTTSRNGTDRISAVLADHGIAVEATCSRNSRNKSQTETAMILEGGTFERMLKCADEIGSLDVVSAVAPPLPVETPE